MHQEPAHQKVEGKADSQFPYLLGGCHHGVRDGLDIKEHIVGGVQVPKIGEVLLDKA